MFISESVAIALILGVVCCFALRYARRFRVRAKSEEGEVEIACGENESHSDRELTANALIEQTANQSK